jgi:hypothetical protein
VREGTHAACSLRFRKLALTFVNLQAAFIASASAHCDNGRSISTRLSGTLCTKEKSIETSPLAQLEF